MLSIAAIGRVIDELNRLQVAYVLTGSLARNVYCSPRATIDADFVVVANPKQLQQLFQQLKDEFQLEEQMAFETVTGKTQHKLRHRASRFLIEIFEARLDDPHERSRLERRQPLSFERYTTYVTTAEDVIVQKLRWYKQIRRGKDRDDTIEVMMYQWKNLDWPYIEQWCVDHGTLELLTELKREASQKLAAMNPDM